MTTGRLFRALLARELARALVRPAEALLPPLFFLLVAIVFAFALGPEPGILARAAAGVLWVGALLASLLPVAGLWATDHADGTLDQFAVRGISAELLALTRIASGFLLLGLPLLLVLPVAALLLGLPVGGLADIAMALGIGTAGLSALSSIVGALLVGARGGGGLVAILLVPVALPILIFGVSPDAPGALRLLLATCLLLLAVAPFATAAALRLARG
jgi:heme exporter protein B